MADVVMWPKFDNSSISMREVVITSIFWGFDQKKHFFEGWSWFKFNYLGLALGMTLKLYTSVAKTLKLRVRTFWWLIPTSVDITGEKIVCVCWGGGAFCSLPILNRVDLKHWETQLNFTNSEREKASSWTRSCWSLPIWRSAYLSANFQLLTFISNPEQSNRVTRYKISKQYLRIIYL